MLGGKPIGDRSGWRFSVTFIRVTALAFVLILFEQCLVVQEEVSKESEKCSEKSLLEEIAMLPPLNYNYSRNQESKVAKKSPQQFG